MSFPDQTRLALDNAVTSTFLSFSGQILLPRPFLQLGQFVQYVCTLPFWSSERYFEVVHRVF